MLGLFKATVDSTGGAHYAPDFRAGGSFRLFKLSIAGWNIPAHAFNAAEKAVLESLEDLEDLEDGLATLRKYQSQGASGFVPYSDYTENRRRRG
jgi:hypothetical protein